MTSPHLIQDLSDHLSQAHGKCSFTKFRETKPFHSWSYGVKYGCGLNRGSYGLGVPIEDFICQKFHNTDFYVSLRSRVSNCEYFNPNPLIYSLSLSLFLFYRINWRSITKSLKIYESARFVFSKRICILHSLTSKF